MTFGIMYYIQTDLLCAALVLTLLMSGFRHGTVNTTDTMYFNKLGMLTILYCLLDALAWVSDGRTGSFWYWALMISNLFYLLAPDLIAGEWMLYVFYKTDVTAFRSGIRKHLLFLPLYVVALLTVSTPATSFAFRITEGNHYERTIGTWVIPIMCWVYLVISVFAIGRFLSGKKNPSRRDEVRPLLLFFIPVLVASALQMTVYGISANTVGFSLGLLLIFLSRQYNKISSDELTGLNNRRELTNYLDSVYSGEKAEKLYLCMIDIDFFKQINDKYGHLEGDEALICVAELLKAACRQSKSRLFLCRYGGDEFVIAGLNRPQEEPEQLKHRIEDLVNEWNRESKKPYRLMLSIGSAFGALRDYPEPGQLLSEADQAMYYVKERQKAGRH